MDALADSDKQILDLETRQFSGRGVKENAIRRQLGLSPIQYYQRLNELVESPAAAEYAPLLLARLGRRRQQHQRLGDTSAGGGTT